MSNGIYHSREGVTAFRDSIFGRIKKRGILLTMKNGARWLHPYDGSKPFEVKPVQASMDQGV